ncbi:DMT family transporter [Paracoccus sulfuroxidans]|uniref:Putative membrane protein n=1 Tax=Paracoccus sulfuroxidans TaxID=384678 RepID=A0A562NY61_9RHOB|nr:DMT family transporter [Paracoccus sulfuroxidans]TWI37172.1 putative membrane protein [Paracoccus sulfuroxidans]
MPLHEIAAVGAAMCWAVTGLVSQWPAQRLGAFGFTWLRQSLVAVMLLAVVAATGRWHGVQMDDFLRLALSGFIGIFLGDTLLYFALLRLGPRRSGALFALNAPLAALLGWVTLGEDLTPHIVGGIILTTLGVALAVLGRPGRSGQHRFEKIEGPVWIGVGFGILAAVGQAVGSLIARPVMASGFDPLAASMIRVCIAVLGLSLLISLPFKAVKPQGRMTPKVVALSALSGFMAMGVGMTLLMFALQGGKVGVVSTLSALSPVLILPVIWLVTGMRPSATSWAGALVAVAGMALIFL